MINNIISEAVIYETVLEWTVLDLKMSYNKPWYICNCFKENSVIPECVIMNHAMSKHCVIKNHVISETAL